MGAIDLIKTLKNHKSGWVSISKDNKKVLTSAKTLKLLLAKLDKMGNPSGYIMKAAKDFSTYVG